MTIRSRDRIARSILSGLCGLCDSGGLTGPEIPLVLGEAFIIYMREQLAPEEIEPTLRAFIQAMAYKANEIADLSPEGERYGLRTH